MPDLLWWVFVLSMTSLAGFFFWAAISAHRHPEDWH